MNENIDLTKILEGCPEDTEFYSTIYGKVSFVRIDLANKEFPILISAYFNSLVYFLHYTKDGRINSEVGECTLFPSKDQRDWSKFERFWNKPKVEKFDVNTLQPFDKILVRDAERVEWEATFFCYIDHKYCNGIVGINGQMHYMAIPYNDNTKQLLGTTKDCPDYYKWWEIKMNMECKAIDLGLPSAGRNGE